MDEVVEALEKYQGLVPLVYDVETMGLAEARPQDMQYAVYLKREADKVIAEKDTEIDELKERIEVLNHQVCKMNCAMVKHYNEVCDDLIHQKFKRCLKNREICVMRCDIEFARQYPTRASFWMKWERKWLELAEKFKEGV